MYFVAMEYGFIMQVCSWEVRTGGQGMFEDNGWCWCRRELVLEQQQARLTGIHAGHIMVYTNIHISLYTDGWKETKRFTD